MPNSPCSRSRCLVASIPPGLLRRRRRERRSKPGLAPGEAAGRAWLPAAIQSPGSALGLAAIHGKGCRIRRKERCLATDRPTIESRRRLEVERREKVTPTQSNFLLL